MKKRTKTLAWLLALVLVFALLPGEVLAAEQDSPEELLAAMTTEEKVTQLLMPALRYYTDEEGTLCGMAELTPDAAALLEEYAFAGVVVFSQNAEDTDTACRLMDDMQRANSGHGGTVAVLAAYDNEVLSMEYAVGRLRDEGKLAEGMEVSVHSIQRCSAEEAADLTLGADHVVIVSELYSAAGLTGDYSKKVDAVMESVHGRGGDVIVMSCNLPYDAARYPQADAVVLAWSARGMSEDPRFTGGAAAQYGPNMPAALYLILSPGEGPTGRLPVDIPKLDGQGGYTEDVLYPRGYGLSYGAPAVLTASAEAAYIKKYGNVVLSLTCDELMAAGYAFGDIVTVSFLDRSLDLPLCSSYSDVDSGTPGLFARNEDMYVTAAVNMGDFATSYGIAVKTADAEKGCSWAYADGVQGPVTFTISMKEPGGCYDEYVMHRLSYTDERADYPELKDAEFANFRAVTSTGMGKGILYRSASPVNPKRGRSAYADAELRGAGVTVVMDLADDEAKIKSYEGSERSYFVTLSRVALNLGVDIAAAGFRSGLAEGLRFFAERPGVYAVICNEGKDRTGFVIALLECLMGASYDEVVADYMATYSNYYGVTEDDPRYETIAKSNIVKSLCRAFAVTDLQSADLSAEAEEYIKSIGLSDAELDALRANLSVSRPSIDVPQGAWYADAVAYVYERGLMIGMDEAAFCPDGELTRAQSAALLMRLDDLLARMR